MEKKRSVGRSGQSPKGAKGRPSGGSGSRKAAGSGPSSARGPRGESSSRRFADGPPERPARAPRGEGSSRRFADGPPERPARAPRGEGSSRRFADGPPERPARAPRGEVSSRRFADREGRDFSEPEGDFVPTESLVWGKRSVLEFLRKGAALQRLFVTTDGAGLPREFFELAKEQAIPVVRSQKARLDAMTGRANHQGVVASLGQRNFDSWEEILQVAEESGRSLLVVALDGVQDPGNFGAILRTAEGAGCHGVVVGANRSCPLSATVSKTSAGADAHLKIARVEKLERILDSLVESGVQVVASSSDATTSHYEVDWTRPSLLILGAEGEGMNPNLLRRCTLRVRLPMLGKVESLNVSASAAALLYEAVRQRS